MAGNDPLGILGETASGDPLGLLDAPVQEKVTETVTETPSETSIPTVTMDANDGLVPEGSGEFDIKNPTKATGVINIPKGGVTSVALQVEQDKLANNQSEYVKNAKNEIRKLAINTDFSAPPVDPMEGQQQQLIEGGTPDAAVAPKVTDYEQALNYIINPENTPENQIQLSDTDKEDLAKYAQVAAQSAPAIQQLSKQLEQNPDDVKTLNDLADVLSHTDDTAQALSLYSKANAIQENGQSLMGLGNTFLKAGDNKNARNAFEDAYYKDKNPDALVKAAYAESALGNTAASLEMIDNIKEEFPNYSYGYALSAYNNEKLGDKSAAAVDNATYEILRQQEMLPESVNADDPNSDYAKERASQAARLGAIHDAIAAPINFFGEMEMGTIEGGIHGLKNFVEGGAGLQMGGDKIGSVLNILNGAAETAFSGAMAMAPVTNAGFHMLPESVNKVLMQPLNVVSGLSDKEIAQMSGNKQALLALGNTLGSIAVLGAVHKGKGGFSEKENEAILNIVKGESIDSEGLSLKGIVDKAKKVLEDSKLTDYQQAEQVWKSIPEDLSIQDKMTAIPDLIKRERLQEEMAKASPAFKNYFKEKIDKVDEDINAKLSINLGLKEQAAEKTKSAEKPQGGSGDIVDPTELNKQHQRLATDLLNRQKELLSDGVRDFSTDKKWNEINDGLKEVEQSLKKSAEEPTSKVEAIKKPTFENVPVFTRTPEEIEFAKNEVFNNLSKLEIGSVIENSDGEIKVVTENSIDKKGNQLIGVITYERQADGSLRQMTNIVWAEKKADGKIKLEYSPHLTGTNSKGERVTVTDQITDKKIDLSKENIFAEDKDGNLIQVNKVEPKAEVKEVLMPEYSEKLKDVSPETKVVDLPDGISVEFNGEKGTIGRSETGETLFINAEGKPADVENPALKDVEVTQEQKVNETTKKLENIDKADLEFISRKENNRRKGGFYEKAKGILFKGFGGNASIISDKFGSKYKYFTDNPDYAKSFSLEKEYLTQKGKVEKYETNYKKEFNTNEKDYNNEVLRHSGKKSINDLTSKDFDNFNDKLKADGYDVVKIKRTEPLIPSESYRGHSADIRNVEVEEHLILNENVIKKIADQPLLLENNAKSIAEAYHKAKADGTNPELVKAVEDLLGKAPTQYKEALSHPAEQSKVADAPSSRPIEKFESGVAFEEAGSGHNVIFTDKDGKKSVVGKVFGTEGKTGAEFDSWVKPQIEAIHYKEVVKAVERGDVVPKEVLDHYLSSKIEGDYNGMLAEAIKSVKENGPKKEIFSEQEIGEVMDKRAEELSQMKRTKDYVFQLIHDNFGGITEAQWNRFGDANWLKGKEGKKFRKKYIKNDAGKTDTNDFGSFSLSSGEGSSIEITPQNVVDYIMDREFNPKKYDGRLKQWNDAASIPKKDVPSLLSGDDAMVLSIAESNRGLGMTDLEVDTIKRYVESKAKNEARAKNTKPRSAESAPKSEGSTAKSERVGRKPGEKAQKKKDEAKSVKAEESKYVEAEKKITKIFDTLRAKLIADLPEGTKKSGVGAKEVLDAAEKIVKAALKAGEAIEKAIQKGKDYINENWKKEFGDIENIIGKESEVKPKGLNQDQLKIAESKDFKEWFGDWEKKEGSVSKVINKDGEPLVVYHGSPKIFSDFNSNKLGEYTGADLSKEGFFFSDKKSVSETYRKAAVLDSPNLSKLNNALGKLTDKKLIKLLNKVFGYGESQFEGTSKKDLIEEIFRDVEIDSEGVYSDRRKYIEGVSEFLKKEGIEFNPYKDIGSTNSVFLNMKKPFTLDAKGEDVQQLELSDIFKKIKKEGHDGVIIKNAYDAVVFEEKGFDNIKSNLYIIFKPDQAKIINSANRVFEKDNLSKYYGAEKSVKAAFEKLREKLIPRLPEGTEKMGLGMEDLLNAAEKVIIGAIRAGEKIDVAIGKGLDHLKEKWDDSFGEFPEKELRDILKENGEIQLSHEKTDALREKYGMEEREINDPVSTEKTRAEAQKIIKKGFDVIKLANEVIKKERTITPVERAILAERVAILDKELLEGDTTSPEYAKKMEEQNKLIKASEISASQAGSSLGSIAHIKVVADESLSGYFQEQRRVNKEGALTEKQTATNKKEFEEITKVKEAYEKRIAKIQEENNRLKAEKQLEKLAKKTSKRTAKEKLDEDFDLLAKEFSSIAKNTLNAGINPELIPVVLKMVKNRVEKGVITLSEVVDAVHEKVGEFGISKEDIIAAIAGKHGPERTRSDAAKNLYELKQEAKLVQKLTDLQNGKEPSSERGKVQKNARLEELRKQIKEHDLTKTAEYKKRLDAQIAEVERELATGDFAVEEKKEPLKLDKETLELQDKYMQLSMEREARLLREEYAQRSMGEKAADIGMSIMNAPMTLMSSGDLSAVLRQGLVASTSHPILAARASKRMLKFFKSQKDFDRWHFETKNDPRYLQVKEAGLAIVDPHDPKLAAREEAFMGNIVEKIPIYGSGIRLAKIKDGKLVRTEGEYGGLVKASERAYVGFLNKMRWDVYNLLSERLEKQGITFENNPTLYKELASHVNNITGRGNIPKKMERLSPALNAAFFSPRLWASRLKLLSNWANPLWYKKVPKEVRRFYWEDMGKFAAAASIAYLLSSAGGADVETDIRSSDFLKIRNGKKRYDILGGFQQPIRTLGQYATGQKKDIDSGEITELTDSDKSLPNRLLEQKRLAVLLQHIRGKLSPVPAAFTDFGMGRMMDYSEPTVEKEIMRMIVPLAWQDITSAYGEEGAKSFVTTALPTILGVSNSIYKDPEPEPKEKPKKASKPKKKRRVFE